MTKDYEGFLQHILGEIKKTDYIHSENIPNIDLYMDQVTTFMDENLGLLKRHKDNKTLTKTMINNYSKAEILPSSLKKKYSKDHMLLLVLIYYLKHTLSIPDIKSLIEPLRDMTDADPNSHNLETFFNTMTDAQIDHFDVFNEQILETVKISKDLYEDQDDGEILSIISTVYLLSMQAAIQKYLATALIDKYLHNRAPEPKKESKKESKKETKSAPKDKIKVKPKDLI
jgi:hypothetical protein